MENFFNIDWHSIFVPTESLLEIFLRGTIMYLGMFVLLRIFRRQTGSFSIADLLVIVIIADAAQNGMSDDAKSVTESLLLIGTIIFWDYLLDFLGFKSKLFERILEPQRLKVIENGKFLHRNMRKEMITEDDVTSQMRENGIEDVKEVKMAYLESDGNFSFIKKESSQSDKARGKAEKEKGVH